MSAYLMEACKNTFIVTDEEAKIKCFLRKIKEEKIDGLIVYKNNPLSMKIYNRDGSLASMCGNGIRCFLLFGVVKENLTKGYYEVKTDAGYITCNIVCLDPFECEILLKPDNYTPIKKEVFFVDGILNVVYTTCVTTLSHVLIYKTGDDKEKIISRLKNGVLRCIGNINFVNIISKSKIEVLTYERGVGYTFSCATGNAASFYVLHSLGLVNNEVEVINKGGSMNLKYLNCFIKIKHGARICQII